MLTKRSMVPVVLLLALLVPACSNTPSLPTVVPAPPVKEPPPPSPPPPTEVLARWNVTARLTEATGSQCATEAVRSVIGASKGYSITLTRTGSEMSVTVTGASADYDCTFSKTEADDTGGFTTIGTHGIYTCRTDFATHDFRCSDGTVANLITFGQDVSGTVSGNAISGTWLIDWYDRIRIDNDIDVETTTEFTGLRQ